MSDENRSPVHYYHTRKVVELLGGPPWGFRIHGGRETNVPLKVARVNPGSKAAKCGIRDGDLISNINGQSTEELTNVEVQKLIKKSGDRVTLELKGASKRMGALEGSSGLSPGLSANDQAPATSLSTSQLSSSGAPAVPLSIEDPNVTPIVSSTPATAATSSATPTKAEKKEKKKSDKSKKKSSQSPSKGEETKDKSRKSGKHQQQQQATPPLKPQQQPESVDKATSPPEHAGDAIGDGSGVGGGAKIGKTKSILKNGASLETNGKQKQRASSSTKKGNGMITGVSSSLLGDIIAELDDLLDADFFNVATNSDNFNANEGVWTPGSTNTDSQPTSPLKPVNNVASSSCSDLPTLEDGSAIPPVWTPPSAPSPSSQRKFRPVNFNVPGSPKSTSPRSLSLDRSNSSPQLPTRQPQQESHPLQLQASSSLTEQSLASQQQQQQQFVSSPDQNDNSSRSDSIYQTSSGSASVTLALNSSSQSTVSLPKYQSPTVVLLQKAREGQLPKGAHYLEQPKRTPTSVRRSVEGNTSFKDVTDSKASTGSGSHSNATGLTLNLESNDSSLREVNSSKVTERGTKEYEGIGPTTPEGVPIATKPAIRSEQQHQWYKRMYESLHVERPQRRGPPRQLIHGGGHSAGHYSEPEGYESDTYAYKYATLDRRKLRDRYSESTECFSPSPSTPNSILSPTKACPPPGVRFTPGRIEDYTPGNSCVIAKEIRKHKPTLQWALGSRDLGYESDSTLIIRRRQEEEGEFRGIKSPPPPPLSPAEHRQIYVEIQKGGEVPLKGLRKLAPERPKESWLNLIRLKVRSMPTFEEMKQSIPFSRGRSGSPKNYRSGSPVCKSPPPNSTVALLQERIQEKIRRSNSDLSPRPSASFRTRYGLSGVDASRIIHTVRSTSTLRRAGSSSIPIRSRDPSVEKLRVSSPELQSPREVKKAMQNSHRLSIKLEVVKSSPPSSSANKRGKEFGTSANEGKKSGLRKTSTNGKHSRNAAGVVSTTSTKSKSVKISDKVLIENNNVRTVTSISNGKLGSASQTNNESSNGTPVKPPRKVKSRMLDSSCSEHNASEKSNLGSGGGGKIHKVSKVSPVASRHASCLSPHTSRPTSPGSGLSSAISVSNSSLNASSVNGANAATAKFGSSSCEKLTGPTGKFPAPTASALHAAAIQDSAARHSLTRKKVGNNGESTATSALSPSTTKPSIIGTTAARKLIREIGERKQGNGTNRISLSPGKNDRKSPEKEKQPSTTKSSKVTTAITAFGLGVKQKDSGGGGVTKGGEIQSKFKNPYANTNVDITQEKREKVCVEEKMERGRERIKSNSNIDLREETIISSSTTCLINGKRGSISKRDGEDEGSLGYWTIPPRRGRELSPKLGTTISSCLERPMSLFAFRSLPALTPYLTETKRVSESLFLTKQQSVQIPLVRPTKTSALRERLAREPPGASSTLISLKSGKDANAKMRTISRGKIIRSVSCLTLKEKLIRDYTYTNYILELQHARKRSPRFLQLHRLYSSLERLGQLERSTSLYDIPVLSAEKQLDFDAWWKVRNRLRVEEEMSNIVNQLMMAQKNREFFFRPKSPEAVRWRGDSALRCKQWNIDELRHFLLTGELLKSNHTSASDLHKTAWRGTSVKEVALNMEVASLSKADYYYYRDKAAEYTRMPALRRAFSMSSTLSDDQKEKIKSRLGTLIVKKEKGKVELSPEGKYGTMVTIKTSRMGLAPSSKSATADSDIDQVVGIDGSLTETAKRQLSKTLSEEFQERKMKERESIRFVEGSSGNMMIKSSGESESDSSIKTVIHVPVSTKMLLRKCQEQQANLAKANNNKAPVYSVYCTKGVPSKVSFFETFHKDSNNNKEPIVFAPSEAKIVKTKSYSERVNGKDNKDQSSNSQTTTFSRSKSPIPEKPEFFGKRSRSATPEKRGYDSRYMSHINVISKLASLLLKKDNSLKNLVQREVFERDKVERLRLVNAGEVDRLKSYFEDHVSGEYDSNFHPEISLLRCLFCSDPNLARLTEKFNLGSNSAHRRCASADIFKEKLDYFEGRDRDRIRPDGKESSPVHSRSPELYFSSRSRRPIYQPSSTPNICQPTLTAHCFLESPTKSMEFDTSCYSSDFSGNYWDYHSTSPAPSSTTAAAPYSPPTATAAAGAHVALSGEPNAKSNREISYSSVPPRILQSRVPPNAAPISINTTNSIISNKATSTGAIEQDVRRNWNFDPALHQPKYRYVPQPPILEPRQYYGSSGHFARMGSTSALQPGSLPPTLQPPPIPPPPMQHYPGRLAKSESFHMPSTQSHMTPQMYRSVRQWNPNNVRGQSTREYHLGGPATSPSSSGGLGQNVGLPLQRSASLNYAHHRASTNSNNFQQRIAFSSSATSNSAATDIDSQIRLIESQFDSNENIAMQHEPLHSVTNSSVSDAVPVANNSADAATRRMLQIDSASSSSPVKYAESEVNIHYRAPVRFEEKEYISEEELRQRQEIAMRRFYEEQRQRKFLQEIQDMENRRHMDNFTPSQKSPIPLNRYDDVIDELPKGRWREKTPESKMGARALYNFQAQNPRELSFRKGDILFVRRKVDSNWYEGEHNAAVGIFPCSYVEIIPAYDVERATPRISSEGQAKVRFNFTAATPSEMSIIKGETVVLTRRVDANWYEGRIGSRRGIFPTSYVHVLKEPGMDLTSSSSKSPKPIGAPAAHSLVTQNGGGIYSTSRHSYKPNEYSLTTDLSNIDAFNTAHSSVPSGQHHYRKENILQQQHLNTTSRSQSDPARNRYAQNLTIDTRIEPIPYRAVYNYKPAHEDELELMEGDVVHVLEKCDDGWFVGTSQRTGLFGTFPGNYVERIY